MQMQYMLGAARVAGRIWAISDVFGRLSIKYTHISECYEGLHAYIIYRCMLKCAGLASRRTQEMPKKDPGMTVALQPQKFAWHIFAFCIDTVTLRHSMLQAHSGVIGPRSKLHSSWTSNKSLRSASMLTPVVFLKQAVTVVRSQGFSLPPK